MDALTTPRGTPEEARLRRWQVTTVAVLLVGYAGYYLCRSNLSVAAPMMLAESSGLGLDRQSFGLISSLGVFAYAIGKLVTGVLGDFLGGRRMFLVGLFGAVLASVVFGLGSGISLFVAAWILNRFVQSGGWGGLVKVASAWFSPRVYGSIMGVLSLSFLFGDAAGRYFLGTLISRGFGWRAVFFIAAAVLAAIGLFAVLLLRSRPRDLGLPEPPVSPLSLFGPTGRPGPLGPPGDDERPASVLDLLRPYARSGSFWLVCAMSCGLTLIRETLNTWIPVYLVDVHGVSVASAAQYSALFPFVGGLSTLATGWASDRVGKGNRAAVAVPCLALCAASLAGLAWASRAGALTPALFLIGSVAFWLLGPYSLLAGAMAMDLGGRTGPATAAGLIDSAGYLGAVLSGFAFGRLVDVLGWATALRALVLVAGLTLVAALAYWRLCKGAGLPEVS
ncbi:MAG: MFS transporter [Vicinamibacterales bacterium]